VIQPRENEPRLSVSEAGALSEVEGLLAKS